MFAFRLKPPYDDSLWDIIEVRTCVELSLGLLLGALFVVWAYWPWTKPTSRPTKKSRIQIREDDAEGDAQPPFQLREDDPPET